MYASRIAMVDRFGESEVVALTDRTRTGQIDDSVLLPALESASAEIDGYLAGRFPLPLTNPPRILAGYACDIARYRLCGSGTRLTEDIRDRFRDAVRFLELAAAGKVSLGGMPDGGAAPSADDSIQFHAGTRVFARDAGGY